MKYSNPKKNKKNKPKSNFSKLLIQRVWAGRLLFWNAVHFYRTKKTASRLMGGKDGWKIKVCRRRVGGHSCFGVRVGWAVLRCRVKFGGSVMKRDRKRRKALILKFCLFRWGEKQAKKKGLENECIFPKAVYKRTRRKGQWKRSGMEDKLGREPKQAAAAMRLTHTRLISHTIYHVTLCRFLEAPPPSPPSHTHTHTRVLSR